MYQYLSVVNSSSSAIRCMQTESVSLTAPAPLYAVFRLYQYLSVVNSCSSAIRFLQTVLVSISRQQLQLRYTLFIECISIYMSSTAPAPLYAVYRLYQYFSVVNSSSYALRCLQTVSVSICRQQLQHSYMFFIDCISIYLSSIAPAPLYAVCRLYQYLFVVKSSSSAIRWMQTVLVSSTAPARLYAVCRLYQDLSVVNSSSFAICCMQTVLVSSRAPAPLYAVCRLYQYLSIVNSSSSAIRCLQTVSVSICRQQLQLSYTLFIDCISIYLSSTAPAPLYAFYRLYQYRQELQLRYTLYVDCINIYLSSTAPAPLYAVYRLYQYLSVVNSCSSALRFLQTVSVSISRQQLQLLYTLYVDCISIYLSSTAPAQLQAVYRLYKYLSVVNSSSSSIRCLQTVSVSICRQQLQLRYTLFIDCISTYLSSIAPAIVYAVCRLYQYLAVVNSSSSGIRCVQTVSVSSTAPAPLYAVCRLYQNVSFVNSSSSAIRCLQTVSVSIWRQQLQLLYTLFIDYQYLSVLNSSSSCTRCLQTVSVFICRQQLQLLYTLFIDGISIYLSSTTPAPLYAVYMYQYLSDVNSSSSAIRCMQTESVSLTAPAPLYAVFRLYQYLSVVNSCSSAIRFLQTVLVSISRQQLQLRYTLFIEYISIYMSSTAPAPLYAVYRLYQYLSVVNSSSSAIRCLQTVSVSICRQQLQLSYTLYVDCICISLWSTAPAPLYAVYRLYQYLSVVNSSSSCIRCMQTVSVSSCRQQLQLWYTLCVDCISMVNSSSSAIRCMQTVSISICRQQLHLSYTLFIDCISIYLASTAPAPLYAVYRLSVSICPQQLQVLYTLFIDCISIYLPSTAPAPLHAVYRRYQYLFVVNNSSPAKRCLYVSVSICRQQLQLRYMLYVD